MKRNKWLACGLTAAMVMGLAACGNSGASSNEASTSKATDEVKQESSQAESKTEEAKAEASSEPVTLEWWKRPLTSF